MNNEENRLVQVCAECGRACCWHGEFFCDNSFDAGLKLKTVKELNNSNLEHHHHYSVAKMEKIYGVSDPFGFSASVVKLH